MAFSAPDTDLIDQPESFTAPDDEVVSDSGFKPPSPDDVVSQPETKSQPKWTASIKPTTADNFSDLSSGDPAKIINAQQGIIGKMQEMLGTGLATQNKLNSDDRDAMVGRLIRDRVGQIKQNVADSQVPIQGVASSALESLTKPLSIWGDYARGALTDVTSPNEGGGNLWAALNQRELPVDVLNRKLAPSHPYVATLGMAGQGVVGSSPYLLTGGWPAVAQKLVAAGFSAQMIASVKDTATQYGEQMGLPPDKQDPAKIAELRSSLIQAGVFAPLTGAFAGKDVANKVVTKVLPENLVRTLTKPLTTGEQNAIQIGKSAEIPLAQASQDSGGVGARQIVSNGQEGVQTQEQGSAEAQQNLQPGIKTSVIESQAQEPAITEADVRKDLVNQGLADLQPDERAEVQAAMDKLARFEDLNPREQALVEHLRDWVNNEMESASTEETPLNQGGTPEQVAPPPEPLPAQPAKVGEEITPEVRKATVEWAAAEKRLRRALRQDPNDLSAAQNERDNAAINFKSITDKLNIPESVYNKLLDYVRTTDTERMPKPTPSPVKLETKGVEEQVLRREQLNAGIKNWQESGKESAFGNLNPDGTISIRLQRFGQESTDTTRGGTWYELNRGDISDYNAKPETGAVKLVGNVATKYGVGGGKRVEVVSQLKNPFLIDATGKHEGQYPLILAKKVLDAATFSKLKKGITGLTAEKSYSKLETAVSNELSKQGYDSVVFFHKYNYGAIPHQVFKLAEKSAEPTPPSVAKPVQSPVEVVAPTITPTIKNPLIVGLGAAIPEEFKGNAGTDIYGIAQRVRDEMVKAGQVASVQGGEGISASDSVEHGRELLSAGGNPEKAISNFEKTKRFSSDDMALVRAKGEQLFQSARNIEEKFGTDSKEYQMAWQAKSDWMTRVKPMQTEWSKSGQAQQGETDIDTGSFTGLQDAYFQDTGKVFTSPQAKTANRIANMVRVARNTADVIKQKLYQQLDLELGDVNVATPKNLDEARFLFSQYETGKEFSLQQVKTLWNAAKTFYLDRGIIDFDDIRNGLATDFGMKVEDVTRALAQPKGARKLTDTMWKRQTDARRAVEQAKRWLKTTQLPIYQRIISSIPRILFGLKVGFHGTVALGTHAPTVAFQPRFWNNYVRDFVKMYRMVGSPSYYEMQVQDLMRRPNYLTARRSGLVNDPFMFEDYNSPDVAQYVGRLSGMGNRGYAVLKILRQDMFDQHWNKLPETTKIPEIAKAIADGINHATGVVKVKAPKGANIALFAPRLEMSRAAWLVTDPIKAADTFARWGKATPAEKYFAINQVKEKAWVAGTLFSLLALNQGVLSAINSKQKINGIPQAMGGLGFDPTKSDFLKFKVAGMDLAYGSSMLSMMCLPVKLYKIRSSEGGKLKNLISSEEDTASALFGYGRSQLSPFASLASTLWFRSDYQNRQLPNSSRPMPKRLRAQGVKPYTWPEFWSEQLSPIPVEDALKEVWKNGFGMNPEQIKNLRKAMSTIAVMGGTGARLSDDVRLGQELTRGGSNYTVVGFDKDGEPLVEKVK